MSDTDVNYARTHSAMDVAGHFLYLADNDTPSRSLTPMQLLKLVYIAHGWMLGMYGRSLVQEEIQAWKYGPIIPDLYDKYRFFKHDSITGTFQKSDELIEDEETNSIVTQTYAKYGLKSGITLSAVTHQKGTPWSRMWECGGAFTPIPNDLIQEYYGELYENSQRNHDSALQNR